MSDFFNDEPDEPQRPVQLRHESRRPRPLVLTLIVMAVLLVGFSLFAGIWTDKLWFTSLGSDALGAIDPSATDPAATISMYALPDGSRPVALKSGPDGRMWFSLRGIDAIGSLDPRAPSSSLNIVNDPAINAPAALFVTPDGTVWWINSGEGTLGRLDAVTGAVSTVAVPARPRAWAQTPDGLLWVTTREPAGLLSFDSTFILFRRQE